MLEAKIVVQMAGAMLLDDEFQRALPSTSQPTGGLRRHIEAAFAMILGESAVCAKIRRFRAGFLHLG
jgi:hypothetical protein